MTEIEAMKLGFKFTRAYDHNEFLTREYRLGPMQLDFDYTFWEGLVNITLTMDKIEDRKINLESLKWLKKGLEKLEDLK